VDGCSDHIYVIGDFVWTAFELLGEAAWMERLFSEAGFLPGILHSVEIWISADGNVLSHIIAMHSGTTRFQ